MLYMVTFTINIPPMLVYIYTSTMDPMGKSQVFFFTHHLVFTSHQPAASVALAPPRCCQRPPRPQKHCARRQRPFVFEFATWKPRFSQQQATKTHSNH